MLVITFGRSPVNLMVQLFLIPTHVMIGPFSVETAGVQETSHDWYTIKFNSTAHQTIQFELCTALITRALALRSNCKRIARRPLNRTCVLSRY
jgi:hypothetical protein